MFGFYIVECEQNGEDRAEYGEKLLLNISKELKGQNLKAVSRRELYNYRKFYVIYLQIWRLLTSISQNNPIRRSVTSESDKNPIWRYLTSKLQLTDNKELDNSENNKIEGSDIDILITRL